LHTKGYAIVWNILGEDGVEVRSVNMEKFGAIDLGGVFFKRRTKQFGGGLPVTAYHGFRQKADALQVAFKTQRVEYLDGIRRHLYACANLAEGFGALEEMIFDALLLKGAGQGYTANASTYYAYS